MSYLGLADYKHILTQLEPAHLLRSDLQGKLAAALDVPQAQLVVESFASIRSGRELPPPTSSSISSGVPVVLGTPVTYQVRLSHTLTGHSEPISGLAMSTDGKLLVSGSGDNTAKAWCLSTRRGLCTFTGHEDDARSQSNRGEERPSGFFGLLNAYIESRRCVTCIALCPDGKRAVTGASDETLRVWSVDTGKEQSVFRGHDNWVWSVAVSPDGQTVATGSSDDTIKLWNIESGRNEATLTGHGCTVRSLAFSPDGQMLASGSQDNAIKIWNVRAARLERTFADAHSDDVKGVVFTPDGQRLVSGSADNTVKVWNWCSGVEEITFTAHTAEVNCVAAFPDGNRIVSGSSDKSIRIWNIRNRVLEHTLTGHASVVNALAISPDGQTLVSGSKDETIKMWELN